MDVPAWSVLILTATCRAACLAGLLRVLAPQVAAAGGQVEVAALRNEGGLAPGQLGPLRRALVEDARGRWASFIDDDDTVAPYYVTEILAALACDPDYVAFAHAYYEAGTRDRRPVLTGLHYADRGWADTPTGFYRPVTHVNPVRTSLARKAAEQAWAGDGDPAGSEDYPYDQALSGLLPGAVQVRIDEILYHYRHDWASSVQSPGGVPRLPAGPLPDPPGPWFRWHPASC